MTEKVIEVTKHLDIPKWAFKTVKHLRLLLLGQLVGITGVVWFVDYILCRGDLIINCRYGFRQHETLSIEMKLEEANDNIENRMTKKAWIIATAYWKRMKDRYEYVE